MDTVSKLFASICFGALLAHCGTPPNAVPDASDAGGMDIVMVVDSGHPDTAPDVPQDVPPTACNMNTTCSDCGAGDNCGWCASSNRCLDGNSDSSDDGSCTGVNWIWDPAYCPGQGDLCATHSASCDDCAMQAGCGFCPGMGCTAGTGDGPLVGGLVMTCDGWAYQPSDCAASDAGTDAGKDAGSDAGDPDASADVSVE